MYYRDYNIIAGGDINGRNYVLLGETNEMASNKCLFVCFEISSVLPKMSENHQTIDSSL